LPSSPELRQAARAITGASLSLALSLRTIRESPDDLFLYLISSRSYIAPAKVVEDTLHQPGLNRDRPAIDRLLLSMREDVQFVRASGLAVSLVEA